MNYHIDLAQDDFEEPPLSLYEDCSAEEIDPWALETFFHTHERQEGGT